MVWGCAMSLRQAWQAETDSTTRSDHVDRDTPMGAHRSKMRATGITPSDRASLRPLWNNERCSPARRSGREGADRDVHRHQTPEPRAALVGPRAALGLASGASRCPDRVALHEREAQEIFGVEVEDLD